MIKLTTLGPQVDAVLTDAQKSILGSFACCLVPPKDLSDPVRVGQSDASDEAMDLLCKVRTCPDNLWPLMRRGILGHVDRFTIAVTPSATSRRKQDARSGVAAALDRARTLDEVDFELEKQELAVALKAAIVTQSQDEGKFKSAYFLLVPGAADVYTAYIARLDANER